MEKWEIKKLGLANPKIIDFVAITNGNKFVCNVAIGEDTDKNSILISKAPEMFELIKEMSEAITWYQENCIPEEKNRNNNEIFFNLGANLRSVSENLINEITRS